MINWKREWRTLALIIGAFLLCFYLPVGKARFDTAILESFQLVKWYAREHVLLCLVPAFFIAGAISVFVSQASVMKYLGAKANKVVSYGVASVSGTILAVCSCTVLPLFAGIYRMGAGLGPATAFLYSGPAINVLAIALTARVLGIKLGIARAVGAIVFSIVIGLLMHLIFRKEEAAKAAAQVTMPEPEVKRPLWQNALFFLTLVAILVFANWGKPRDFKITLTNDSVITATVLEEPAEGNPEGTYRVKPIDDSRAGEEILLPAEDICAIEPAPGPWSWLWRAKWALTGLFSIAMAVILVIWFEIAWWKMVFVALPVVLLALLFPALPMIAFAAGVIGLSTITSLSKDENGEWFSSSWGFAKQILPLLFGGVLVAGLLLGSPESTDGGLIPAKWVAGLVGGNSLWANMFASVVGAFMYFATLTEVPILQGLISNGMGQGPALALLLAGPALSLPNMLVIRSVMGTKKTVVFVLLVITMATISGLLYGYFV